MKLKGIILQKNKIWDAFVAMLKTVLNVLRANKGEENSQKFKAPKSRLQTQTVWLNLYEAETA